MEFKYINYSLSQKYKKKNRGAIEISEKIDIFLTNTKDPRKRHAKNLNKTTEVIAYY